jgi:GNAT superfamily N-acetyltransferase
MPEDQMAWLGQGLDLELDEVLTTADMPPQKALTDGYQVRRLRGRDWAQSVARSIAENDSTHEQDPQSFQRFTAAQKRERRSISNVGASFGAFADGVPIADLGIVQCGTTARYQSVNTDQDHHRRALASHLLGIAARWTADQGCGRRVIVTEASNPAGRVYRSLGFKPDIGNAQAYRKPQP